MLNPFGIAGFGGILFLHRPVHSPRVDFFYSQKTWIIFGDEFVAVDLINDRENQDEKEQKCYGLYVVENKFIILWFIIIIY